MKFFDYQHRARQQTTLLVVLFALAVIALVVLLNFIVALVFFGFSDGELFEVMRGKHWFTITLAVVAAIGGASLLRWSQLQAGGKAIAQAVGGKLVSPESNDFHARRLLNIVEEIAIASGVPVPPVYLLPDKSINAFAAGYRTTDAVIGVTRGAIEKLDRDQLQGVIAHEFSHILNGDMRINIRMMALLYGILFVGLLGRSFLEILAHAQRGRRTSRDANNVIGVLMLVALGMVVLGYLGVFFGNLIKAAVSRQREYLADASAVQFTRNPKGIGGALKRIAEEGSYIPGTASQEASHFFFGDVRKPSLWSKIAGLWATHPPITKRIQRIDPYWRGQAQAQSSSVNAAQSPLVAGFAASSAAPASAPQIDELLFNALKDSRSQISDEALAYARDPGLAPLLVFSILFDREDAEVYAKQEQIVLQGVFAHTASTELLAQLFGLVKKQSQKQQLTLIELSIPALKQMDVKSYQAWLYDLYALIKADNRATPFEWCVYRVLQEYLQGHFNTTSVRVKERFTEVEVMQATAVIMSALAQIGAQQNGHAEAAFNYASQQAKLKGLTYHQGFQFRLLNRALDTVKHSSLDMRARSMRAFKHVAGYDHVLTEDELSLLRALALALDLPMNAAELAAI